MDPLQRDLEALRALFSELIHRVERLERALNQPAASVKEQPVTSDASSAPVGTIPPRTLSTTPEPPSTGLRIGVLPATDKLGLESRIGSQWLSRIGIAAVLVGVSYFLKYAFENNWIGAAGRVASGVVGGVLLVVWSERFRRRGYQAFSYSLKALGLGILYLAFWAAFQVYHLIPAGLAFLAMVAVTVVSAGMALAQNAGIVAGFALAGGFLTPWLLSTGQNRELELFGYIALLDIATLVLAARRPWNGLLLLSYLGTLIYYTGWYLEFYDRSQLSSTFVFATVFFTIFTLAPLLSRPQTQAGIPSTLPLFIAVLNAGAYFLQVYAIYEEVDRHALAWFALGLAVVHVLLSLGVRRTMLDPLQTNHFELLHRAFAAGFVTIAVPIYFDGHWITIGWFVEAAALLWVANRIRADLLNGFAIGVLGLGVIRLLIFDNFASSQLLVNNRMVTYGVAVAVLALVARFATHRRDDIGRRAAAAAIIALNLLLLIALSREVADYYARDLAGLRMSHISGEAAQARTIHIAETFTYSALWMVYGAVVMLLGFWRRSAFVRWQALVLISVTAVKVFTYDVWQLERGYRVVSFMVLGVLLLAISFAYQRDWLRLSNSRSQV